MVIPCGAERRGECDAPSELRRHVLPCTDRPGLSRRSVRRCAVWGPPMTPKTVVHPERGPISYETIRRLARQTRQEAREAVARSRLARGRALALVEVLAKLSSRGS